MAASFVASDGFKEVDLIEEYSNHQIPERALLVQIVNVLSRYKYSFGWYSRGYRSFNKKKNRYDGQDSDLKVLHARLVENDLPTIIEFFNDLPRVKSPRYIKGSNSVKVIYKARMSKKQMYHIDAQSLFKKSMVQENVYHNIYRTFSLNAVCKAVIGRGKLKNLSGKEFNILSIEDKQEYSLEDSQLVYDLLAHKDYKVLKMMKIISDLTGIKFDAVCNYGVSTLWKRIINARLGVSDFLSIKQDLDSEPETETDSESNNILRGAITLPPTEGEYRNVSEYDISSGYPTYIIRYNLSFDSINQCECCKDNIDAQFSEEVIDRDTMKEEKYWRCLCKQGVFAELMEYFTKERLRYKKEGQKMEADCLKILINSGYGVLGSKHFQYYNHSVPSLVTALGRLKFKSMHKIAKEMGLKAIYGDTDYMFVSEPDESPISQSKINELITRCKSQLQVDVELKRVCSKLIMVDEKNYLLVDKDSNSLVVKGLSGIKNDRCKYIRNVFAKMLEDYKDNKDLKSGLKQAFTDLDNKNVESPYGELKVEKKLGKNPDEYENENDVMRRIGSMLNLRKDDLICLFYGENGKLVYISPEEFSIDKLDIYKYKDMLMNCVKRISKILGYSDLDLQEIYGMCRHKVHRHRQRQKDKLTRIKISSQNDQDNQKTDGTLSEINIEPKPVTDQLDTAVKTKEQQYDSIIERILEGIGILITLFLDAGQPLFPRRIMTANYTGSFVVYNLLEMLQCFKDARFIDCRINAYPELVKIDKNRMKSINIMPNHTPHPAYTGARPRQIPNVFMCDVDGIEADRHAEKIMNKIIALEKYTKTPIIAAQMFTGSGNHVYGVLPLMRQELRDLLSREEMGISMDLADFNNEWLRYLENFMSNNSADVNNRPSIDSCHFRVPNSYNSKILEKNGCKFTDDARIRYISSHNDDLDIDSLLIADAKNCRGVPNLLLDGYRNSLLRLKRRNEKISMIRELKQQTFSNKHRKSNKIKWIEKLLNLAICDSRKFCIWHILVPYLKNILLFTLDKTRKIIVKWSKSCNELRMLNFDVEKMIDSEFNKEEDYKPISFHHLRNRNPELYQEISANVD